MALNIQCDSCENLRENNPDFILNGMNEKSCNNLSNNKGLSGKGDNCEDVHDMNDCLVGMMDKEVNAHEACDWKKFMHKFIPNLWSVLEAVICWLCGLQCQTDYLFNGASFNFGEGTTGKDSELRPGTGVDFSIRNAGEEHTHDVTITYVAGGLGRLTGSLRCFSQDFKDADGKTKDGNSVWALNSTLPKGGERLLELRIKKSEYPQIKTVFQGWGFPVVGHELFYEVITNAFDGDNGTKADDGYVYAYGQHGWCDRDGSPSETGYSSGHKVPAGWIYIQMRLAYKGTLSSYNVPDGAGTSKNGFDLTPIAQFGIRMRREGIKC